MSMIRFFRKYSKLRIRSQMFILFVLLSIIPMILVAISSFYTVRKEMITQTRDNISENIKKSGIIIDNQLRLIAESSEMMNIDSQLYDVFYSLNRSNDLDIIRANREIQKVISKYLAWQDGKYSAHLVTSYFRFGEEGKNFYPVGSFLNSAIDQAAKSGQGTLVWIPTYDYIGMFGIENLRNIPVGYSRLFSATRQMNFSKIENGSIRKMPSYIEQPVFVINFTEDYLLTLLKEYSTQRNLDDAFFAVMTKDGQTVCSSGKPNSNNLMSNTVWLKNITPQQGNGSFIEHIGNKEMIFAYAVSDVTDWILVISLPSETLLEEIIRRVMFIIIPVSFVLALLSAFISSLLSRRFSNKILKTMKMIEQVGNENFDARIEYDARDEYAFYYNKINQTGEKIKNLIHENYEVKLRQKDVEIMALNIQLNPHFLYNTLNIMNWISLEENAERTSEMIVALSRMLHYTSDNSQETTSLDRDLEWMKQYLFIMSLRYEDRFEVSYEIPQYLMELQVPKLFLQPFVENAIIHGFRDIQNGGKLSISGMRFEDKIVFFVEDNGAGMSLGKIDLALNREHNSIGIQNINKRIKVLFGNEYGVQIYSEIGLGTIVTVSLPLQSS